MAAGVLAALSFVLYLEALSFGFIRYDDQTVLLGHPALYDAGSLVRSLHEIVTYLPREEPLLVRDLSWAIDSRVFGFANPFGYHLGNVVLNAVNAALLFLFLQHATRRFGFAVLTALVWTCLPIHVEPVCWVMGRKDLLAATFSLLMFLAQSVALRRRAEGRTGAAKMAEVAVFGLYPLAVLSKFSAVAMVGALGVQRALAEHVSGEASPSARLDLRLVARRCLGLCPHAALGVALYVWYGRQLARFGVTGRGPGPLDIGHLLRVAARTPLVFAIYGRNLLSPSHQAIFYDWPSAGIALTTGQVACSASMAAASSGLARRSWFRSVMSGAMESGEARSQVRS